MNARVGPPEQTSVPIRDVTAVALNRRDAAILEMLLSHEGRVVSYSVLMEVGWPGDFASQRSRTSIEPRLDGISPTGCGRTSSAPAQLRRVIWRLNRLLAGSYRIRAIRKRGYVLSRHTSAP